LLYFLSRFTATLKQGMDLCGRANTVIVVRFLSDITAIDGLAQELSVIFELRNFV
jgi:hypothetical protein